MSGHVKYVRQGDNEAIRFTAMDSSPNPREMGKLPDGQEGKEVQLLEGEEIWVRKGVVKRVPRKVSKKVEPGRTWQQTNYRGINTTVFTITQVEEEHGELWTYGRSITTSNNPDCRVENRVRYGAFHLPARCIPQEYEEEDSFDLHFVAD